MVVVASRSGGSLQRCSTSDEWPETKRDGHVKRSVELHGKTVRYKNLSYQRRGRECFRVAPSAAHGSAYFYAQWPAERGRSSERRISERSSAEKVNVIAQGKLTTVGESLFSYSTLCYTDLHCPPVRRCFSDASFDAPGGFPPEKNMFWRYDTETAPSSRLRNLAAIRKDFGTSIV